VFLALEAATTGCQLLHSMAEASAILAGEDPVTFWERWSRFLEAGGRFVLEVATALVTVAAVPPLVSARPILEFGERRAGLIRSGKLR
jgi:hypothetical protein